MERIVLAVFSGTGNAMRAASLVSKELEGRGYSIELLDLASGATLPELAREDLLILCTSILGFSVPSTVMRALKAAPRSELARVAILCVCGAMMNRGRISGGWSGAAATVALGVLVRKGYKPIGSADISYPENWTQVTEAAMGEDQDHILDRGDGEARSFAKKLLDRDRTFIRRNILTLTVVRFIGFIFRSLARRVLGLLYIADESCNACEYCVRTCPAGAIAMRDGRPVWTSACVGCNRCINLCPVTAIQTSVARALLFVVPNLLGLLFAIPLARCLLTSILPHWSGLVRNVAACFFGVGIFWGFTLLQLGPIHRLVQTMERWSPLRPLFTAGHTRHFRRYRAPGFRPPTRSGLS